MPTKYMSQFYTSDGKNDYLVAEEEQFMYFEMLNEHEMKFIRSEYPDRAVSVAMTTRPVPKNYNLLIAIDPDSEGQLTGIDFLELLEDVRLDEMDMAQNLDDNVPLIPVLQRSDLPVSVSLSLGVENFDLNIKEYMDLLEIEDDEQFFSPEYEKVQETFSQLNKEKVLSKNTYDIDLSPFIRPFDGMALQLNENFEVEENSRAFINYDTSLYYTASRIHYENIESIPTARIIQDGEPPLYKHMEEKGVSMEEAMETLVDIPFAIYQIGTFSPLEVDGTQLAASPLGIYGNMEATAEDGTVLTPTTSPRSFIPSPASGVTTLEHASLFKGDAPIDAIRVKLSGITLYDDEAIEKIEAVATQLLKEGYEVDIVAGSSFKKMTLDVEGIGIVYEPWTTLGVAQQLTSTWNGLNVLTTSLLLFFGMSWLVIRLTFERHLLQEENNVLSMIGWSEKTIFGRNCLEQYIIVSVAFVLSFVVLLFLQADRSMYVLLCGLWIVSLILSTVLLLRKRRSTHRVEQYKWLASIMHYKRSIIPMVLNVCLSMMIIGIQLASVIQSFAESSETTLGEYVGEQAHVFQVAVCIVVLFMSSLSVTEGFRAMLAYRQQEFDMYHKVGWTRRKIMQFMFTESFTWFIGASLIALIGSGLVLYAFGISFMWMSVGIGIAFLLMAIVLSVDLYVRKYRLRL